METNSNSEPIQPNDKPSDGQPLDYDVGYKKPPADTQFKPGNKAGKGRPKGAKNLKTIVNQALGIKVQAKVGGKTVKISKGELALHQLANQASQGDLKAIQTAIMMMERYGPQEDEGGPSPEELALDLDTLRDFLSLRPKDLDEGEAGA